MQKVNRTCPVCKQNGKNTKLELQQINLTEAVYICEDRNCIYPIGFKWEYVKNNILEDSDESSDESIKPIIDKKISGTSLPQINTNNTCSNNNMLEKHKNISNQSITTSSNKKEKINILSNILIANPRNLQKNNKDNKINEIVTKSNEIVRRNNVRACNKAKTLHVSGSLPESVIENAKALSEYFSNRTDQPKSRSKRTIKTVFDIIQQSPEKKQDVPVKSKKSSDEEILGEEARNLIMRNNSIEHNYSIKKIDEVKNNSNYIKSFFDDSQEEINNGLTASFDELLFSNEDKCDKDQSLDISEMDELLSFL